MATRNAYSLLEQYVDPMFDKISPDRKPSEDPLLKLLNLRDIPNVQTKGPVEIDIWGTKADLAVNIGDARIYSSEGRTIQTGKIHGKYMTQAITLNEDEILRLYQNQGSSVNILNDQIQSQMTQNNDYAISELRRILISGLAASEIEGSGEVITTLGAGTGGTLSDPYDLNATPGTPYAGSAIILSGSNKTSRIASAIMRQVKKAAVKVDTHSGRQILYRKWYCGMHPTIKGIFDGEKDILNDTSGQESDYTLTETFANMGVTIVDDHWFDTSSNAISEDETTDLTFFADPDEINMYVGGQQDGKEVWSDWEKDVRVVGGDKRQKFYDKDKSLEFGFHPRSWYIHSADAFYKKVFKITVTAFDDVD